MQAPTDLICLPYAGAGANAFRAWTAAEVGLRIHAVCPPGRETRFGEPLVAAMDPMLDWLEAEYAHILQGTYALFGHSMGGGIAYALARRRFLTARPLPISLVISATLPSWLPPTDPLHRMEESRLRERLRVYDPAHFPFDQHPELWDTFLPVLRADFRVLETDTPAQATRLPVPLIALSGRDDPIATPAAMRDWEQATESVFEQIIIPGGHFFVRDQPLAALSVISQRLRRHASGEIARP